MGSLSKFLGKPKEIEIEGDKIVIHPLKVKDMHRFSSKENASPEELDKRSIEILKLSVPDTTDEEIENLAMDKFITLMEEINKLNGFTDERLDRFRRLAQQKPTGS